MTFNGNDTENELCNFQCTKECSEWCCGGATMITIEEIRKCYDVFPITIGFRKYIPLSAGHVDFLDCIGFREKETYVVGDFIAGNRHRTRCVALDNDNLCRLHKDGSKPFQCRIVPFCAIYPEDKQHMIFQEQKNSKFKHCKGYKNSDEVNYTVWRAGKFTDPSIAEAFSHYQWGLERQRPFMREILNEIEPQDVFSEFLAGEGILEVPIPMALIFNILDAADFAQEQSHAFISAQWKLCQDELSGQKTQNAVLEDYLKTLNDIMKLYDDFLRGN